MELHESDAGDDEDDAKGPSNPQHHIELNLGLGVLEERQPGDTSSSSSSCSSASSQDGDAEEHEGGDEREDEVGPTDVLTKPSTKQTRRERQVLRKLMGQDRPERPDIMVVEHEEIADGAGDGHQ